MAIGVAADSKRYQTRSVARLAAVILLTIAAGACTPRTRVVPPHYPNVFGTVVRSEPDNDGEVFAHGQSDVTLILSDGRRFVLPPSAANPGFSTGRARVLLCRTRDVNRLDGSYASPCKVQARVTGGRASWIRVISGTHGTAVAGSPKWLALADGTAIPMPKPPTLPLVHCPNDGAVTSVEAFTHRHHPVRVEVDADGTLARVDCLSSLSQK